MSFAKIIVIVLCKCLFFYLFRPILLVLLTCHKYWKEQFLFEVNFMFTIISNYFELLWKDHSLKILVFCCTAAVGPWHLTIISC